MGWRVSWPQSPCASPLPLLQAKPSRLHCSHCDETYTLPQNGTIKLYKELRCPLDDFELVLWSSGSRGKSYPLCPYCYNHPPFRDMKKGESTSPWALAPSQLGCPRPPGICGLCSHHCLPDITLVSVGIPTLGRPVLLVLRQETQWAWAVLRHQPDRLPLSHRNCAGGCGELTQDLAVVAVPSPGLGEWEEAAGGGALSQHHQSSPSSCLFLEEGEYVSRWG